MLFRFPLGHFRMAFFYVSSHFVFTTKHLVTVNTWNFNISTAILFVTEEISSILNFGSTDRTRSRVSNRHGDSCDRYNECNEMTCMSCYPVFISLASPLF